ncbi:L-histidine N(alpha)-methyltransferase [Variovorax ureilyticus]|uniref:L-histidine N(Alpha)-methyltransferase n=1 Tax=Variovorax ureilyticus TaxID=1836198 RepID=A0ABU8VQI7_9BURK
MKPRLFIGSSSEKLDIAYAVHANLERVAEITVWTQGVFTPSKYSLEALADALFKTDFGIFVFGPDDVLFMRGKEHKTVRDNVIFELGMFVGRLGRERCFILAPRVDSSHLPSDLLGLSPATYDADRTDRNWQAALGPACVAIGEVVSRLGVSDPAAKRSNAQDETHQSATDRNRAALGPAGGKTSEIKGVESSQADVAGAPVKNHPNCIHVKVDSNVAQKINSNQLPSDWHQRALYSSTEGARAWLAYANEEFSSVLTENSRNAEDLYTVEALADSEWQSFISFGPGDGRRDTQICKKLRGRRRAIEYVPVDISESLIHHSASRLREAGITVPFGLLGDFEDGQDFIFEHINSATKSPRLFSILGNTLGNLDCGTESFLLMAARHMESKDELLIDIAVTNKPWNFDPYKRYLQSHVRRVFIAHGIARQLGISFSTVLDDFEARIHSQRSDNVPSFVQQHVLFDHRTGKIGLTLRAYYVEKFLAWIKKELPQFDVRYSGVYDLEGQGFGAGLIRLVKV